MSNRMTIPTRDDVRAALTALAGLLEYPGADFDARIARAAAAAPLARFTAAISTLTTDEREELYTATFDVTPACVPYVSIHLFGEENFKRGEFMAGLHARYAQAGFDCNGELPDHVAVLLRFAAEADETERRELTEFCLLGPLGKMIVALAAENPYRPLLEAVREVLQAAYPGVKPAPSPREQRQQHGADCAAISSGCNCGRPMDEAALTPARANHEAISHH